MRTYSVDSGGATERLAPVINISERTAKLVAALESKKGAKFSEQQVSLLYHHLLDLGVKPRTIEAQLQEMPDLLHHSLDKWRDTSAAMVGCGLTGLTILQNIATTPRLLQMKSRELDNTLMKLHDIHFGKHNLLTLASSHPALYFVPPTALKKRITALHAMFPTADLPTFLRNNPNVLTEDLKTLMDKIMYIHKVMGLEQPHMASCQGLTHSLLHIKTRHQFLYRSGVYKTPNLLRDYRSDKRNPRLSDILDSSDRFFANKVARLTDEEYTTFKAMMVEEEENELDSYSSSDEEEELF
ncbi:hypothetical protein Pmani_034662 [Petrolisthes manimaculis]|uniref:Uncharacterized protein n=1 Tax=Petrolisthes manimaculis TaxID=1843537 RepID=A0AAE1NNX3_9EUCA|nr:hypothetical protein Pmani_034662 [Petrolisthes manimaculis]